MIGKLIPISVFLLLSPLLDISAYAQNRESVRIGLIFPLTGPMNSFSQDIVDAAPVIESFVNKQQSRYKFTLLIEDGQFGHSNAAITAAKKLVNIDKVKFLVTGSSGETLQVAPFAESQGIVTVAGFASHPAITHAGHFIFRTYIDADQGIQLLSEHLLGSGLNRISVLTETSSFTAAVKQSLEIYLPNNIVSSDEYALGDSDLSSLISKTRQRNPNAVYLNVATPASFVTLFRRLRDAGLKQPIYTYYLPTLAEVRDALGEELNGTFYLDYPLQTDESPEFKSFLEFYRHSKRPDFNPDFNFRTNYNAIKVIVDSISAVGSDASKVRSYLHSYDEPSATGRLRFDSHGDVVGLKLVLKRYPDGNIL